MKKWIVILVIAAIVGGAYYFVINYVEYTPRWLAGEKVKVTRGDLRSPVSASGRVQPAKYIEIKSEASGTVMHVTVEEGDYVLAGETLVVLDPNDEQRSYDIAQLQLQDAETQLKIAEQQAQDANSAGLMRAKANVLAAEAEYEDAVARLDKLKGLPAGARGDDELAFAKATAKARESQLEAAKAAKISAESEAKLARLRAELAEKAVDTAERNVNEAEERLNETVIKAPSNGMIAGVMIQVGQLVQSGTKSLTGGTQLIKLAQTDKLYVVAMVDDADFGLVRKIAPPEARPQMRAGGPKRQRREKMAATQASTQPGSQANDAVEAEAEPATQPSTQPAGPHVDPTQRVRIMVDTFPDEEFEGVIERIDPEGEVHGAIVQYRVHVLLTSENSYEMLQLGLPAQVEFTAESREDVLLVESRCIRREGEEYGVFVPDPTPQDKLNTRFIALRTGISDGTYTEVLPGSGLKEGDEVYLVPPRPPKERGK